MRRLHIVVSALLVGLLVCAALAAPADARRKPRPARQPRPVAASTPSTIPGCVNLATDMGRPVCEIAAELGVPAQVFREAFSHVTPAPHGTQPTDAQRESNHQILLNALSAYGVTAARLDAVSDKYRL